MAVPVTIKFENDGTEKFLVHKGSFLIFNANDEGVIQVEENEFDLILFGIHGSSGDAATITLTVDDPAKLEISGHPIKGKIAQGKTVWGDNRFFRVKLPQGGAV
jgi:hypothetical protein